jgi:hypothetical protein
VAITWGDLRAMRLRGQRPALRVIVTTSERFANRMQWVGCAAILHEAGTPMPVELLDGLDVILDLGNCERASRVKRLMDTKGVSPERLQAWCQCEQSITVAPRSCAEAEGAWLAA